MVYTITDDMGRPPTPEAERRSKMLPIRLTNREMAALEAASRRFGESIADILRKGGLLYIELRGEGGSDKRKEKR